MGDTYQPIPDGPMLRDWFAGQALVGAMDYCRSNPRDPEIAGKPLKEAWVSLSYKIADAMLAEREKSHGV